MDKPEFRVERGPAATDEPFAVGMAKLLEREGRTIAAAELRRLHAQRDALLEVVRKFVAWSEAERDHSGTTFWQRVEMCREVDALAHAAIKAVEGEAK